MPTYKISLNFGISLKLRDYIIQTYNANIRSIQTSKNFTAFIADAPSQQALDAALADIRSKLVEIEELPP
jgi:hypothetical protein